MTSIRSRLLAALLAAVLALSVPFFALAEEFPSVPADPGGEADSSAGLLEITVPDYTPGIGLQAGDVSEVQKGERYTLVVLPASVAIVNSKPATLTADLLTTDDPAAQPLFIGSAVASDNGKVTFTNIHLRTSEAAVYYVTGPGLTTPLAEATGRSTALSGHITYTPLSSALGVANATVSLLDKTTRYPYSNSVQTDSDGAYRLDRLSPGEYYLYVEKPGFLPATSSKYFRLTDGEEHPDMGNMDISSYLGDVNGDGARNISDLTALLSCYGKPLDAIPAGLVPNLFEDSRIDAADTALLINAMITYDKFPAGVGTPTSAAIEALDATPANQTNRTLRFFLNNGGTKGLTFTAANISLTFRTDYIQPINQNGGALYPSSSTVTANCLVPKAGVTVDHARWSVSGNLATLTFSLSCAKPTALTGLVDFLYRPAPGKSASDFFNGIFTVDHAAALVGQATVLTGCNLTPFSFAPSLPLTSIAIDQTPATYTIPSVDHTFTLPLSVTGERRGTTYPNLSGVTWTLSGDGGSGVDGVSISDNLLLITSAAQPGDITITATYDMCTASLTLTLQTAPPAPSQIHISRADSSGEDGVLSGSAGEALTASYTAEVIDQYGASMSDQTVTWSLSGAPAEVSVDESGALTVSEALPAGTYTFSLLAGLDGLRAAVNITLTLEAQLDHLLLSGPATAQIPSGSRDATLTYLLTAIDAAGQVIPSPSFDVEFSAAPVGADSTEATGVTADVSMNGDLTVTVSPDARAGEYTLQVSAGGKTASFTLTLKPSQAVTAAPVRAALSHDGSVVSSKQFTFLCQDSIAQYAKFYPVLLDGDGNRIASSGQRWDYTVSGLDDAPDLSYNVATDHLELTGNVQGVKSGTYFLTISATEQNSGLSASIPVEITVLPDMSKVAELDAPAQLTIPASGSLRYTVGLTCHDLDGNIIAPPGAVRWFVNSADDEDKTVKTTPAGVSIQDGVLTVTPSAKPETVVVHAYCYAPDSYDDGYQMAHGKCSIELTPTGEEEVLVLRRNNELFSGGVDTAYGKEGTSITLSYTPALRDPATGKITELTKGVTWLGLPGAFTVDGKTEPGVYTAPITALYDGQSVSITAQITVYPEITGLYIDFDEGDGNSADEGYSLAVPAQAAKTYYGTLMAKITRSGKTQKVPLTQLGLSDYELEFYTPLTGVYLSYTQATGRVAVTVEPTASSNSMKDPGVNEPNIRRLYLDFSYYPGQPLMELKHDFFLTKENPVPTTAVLRQGKGTGSKFVFETTRGETSITAAAGVVSDCFALELLDQYGNSVLNQYVKWDLTGSPVDDKGQAYITRIDPGNAVNSAYPRYQSIRRLRISPETPEGDYHLTLTASVGATEAQAKDNPTFVRSIGISLSVTGQQAIATLSVSGPDSQLIPMYYTTSNSSAVNNQTASLSFVAAAKDENGNELDSSLCNFSWSVTSYEGGSVDGVTISPDKDNAAAATVTVNRFAKPTPTALDENGNTVKHPLQITVTATPKAGGDPLTATTGLALTHGNLVPALMTIKGPSSYKLDLTDAAVTQEYTFNLVNQYNDPVSSRDAVTVEWSFNNNKNSFLSITKTTDNRGYPAVKLRINNPGKDLRATCTLTATIIFPSAQTSSGKAQVYCNLPITVTVGNPPSGGGGLGGDIIEDVVTASTVTPSTNKTGTTGSVTLGQADIDTLTKTTATGTLTIAPKNTSGLTSITVTFPGSLAKALRDKTQNNSLRIQTALGTVTIPRATLDEFSGNGNASVIIVNQDNTLSVSFRRNSSASNITSFSSGRTVTLTAPVKGEVVTAVSGAVSADVLQKSVINNGSLSVTVTGTASLTLGAKPQTQGKVFSDTYNHWAKDAVNFVVERGLFQGTSETTFSPNGDMTRSMVVTVLHRLENTPSSNASNIFLDVPGNTWYTDAVVWANAHGIVQGNGSSFLPNDPVTREQLATILFRYMKEEGKNTSQRSDLASFSDRAKVSSWAQEAMEWAVATGLITGKGGGILDPGGKATRAEVATMLERLVRTLNPSA